MARYWLSIDLGFLADHEPLFEWLDSVEAKECGENLATFNSAKTKGQLSKELVRLAEKDIRLYLIDMKQGGRFVTGKRKRKAPWDGYAGTAVEIEDTA